MAPDVVFGMCDPPAPAPIPALPTPTLPPLLGAPLGANLTAALLRYPGGPQRGVERIGQGAGGRAQSREHAVGQVGWGGLLFVHSGTCVAVVFPLFFGRYPDGWAEALQMPKGHSEHVLFISAWIGLIILNNRVCWSFFVLSPKFSYLNITGRGRRGHSASYLEPSRNLRWRAVALCRTSSAACCANALGTAGRANSSSPFSTDRPSPPSQN